jgi:hypothetical protein
MITWREEPVTVSAASPRAVLAADEWQRAWEAMAEPDPEGDQAVREYLAAQARADDWAAYCALRAEEQEPRLCKCDGCGATCDLNDDGTLVTRDDEIVCRACGEAPYLAEGGEL